LLVQQPRFPLSQIDPTTGLVLTNPVTGELLDFSNPTGQMETKFRYHGPFFGISYAMPFPSVRGSLQFTTAFTYLWGKSETEFTPVGGSLTDPALYNNNVEGSSLGYNFGISWSGLITDRLGYTLLADTSQYQFDADQGTGDFRETTYRFRVSLSYAFGLTSPAGPPVMPRTLDNGAFLRPNTVKTVWVE
jgi:hypothetical protein